MKRNLQIINELKAIAPQIALMQQVDVYTVPKNYFDNLAPKIVEHIKTKIFLLEAKSSTFKVPKDYFKTLPNLIFSKINSTESEVAVEFQEATSFLNSINKKNIYTVPINYFENFTVPKIKKETTKIISFGIARRWISYAAAATIASILITGGFLYRTPKNSFDVTIELNNVSDAELNNYIENNSVAFFDDSTSLDQELPQLNESLKSVSDEELKQYLKEINYLQKATK